MSLESNFLRSVREYEEKLESIATKKVVLTLAPIFKIQKNLRQLPQGFMIGNVASEPLEQMFLKFHPVDGQISFPPNRLVLGMSRESVIVPNDETWQIKSHAFGTDWEEIPLLVHLNAPKIEPGFNGNIVFEFYNLSLTTLSLSVDNIRIAALVIKMPKAQLAGKSQFNNQSWESNWLPDLSKFDP